MEFIYIQQSGSPVAEVSGNYWILSAVALSEHKWKSLEIRINGLQKNFLKSNYDKHSAMLNYNDLLHPKNAEKSWTKAYLKGYEKIVAHFEPTYFLCVLDKRTTDKEAHPSWLLPLIYHYISKPIIAYLKEKKSLGAIVIPPGRKDEKEAISTIQRENLFGHVGKISPLISSPMICEPKDSCGLQTAGFIGNIARRYQENIFPKLNAKETLEGYDALLNSHYQGFVKPFTYQSKYKDSKGYRVKGYIYLWRKEGIQASAKVAEQSTESSEESSEKIAAG